MMMETDEPQGEGKQVYGVLIACVGAGCMVCKCYLHAVQAHER